MSPVAIIVIKKRQSSKACSKVYVNVKKNIVFFLYIRCVGQKERVRRRGRGKVMIRGASVVRSMLGVCSPTDP